MVGAVGLDARQTKLLRHRAIGPDGTTPWGLWETEPERFERYQSIQSKKHTIGAAKQVCSFVAAPDGSTLFVGIWSVLGVGVAPDGLIDPVMGHDVGGKNLYQLESMPHLSSYAGRLVVHWSAPRSWYRRLDRSSFPVLEILPGQALTPFPGYEDFRISLSQLLRLPAGLLEVLRSSRGVYLLIDPDDGQQYVGAATGHEGFLGRWTSYAHNVHGGNVLLRQRGKRDYIVSILEVAASTESDDSILARESFWKTKLGSRAFGLNAN